MELFIPSLVVLILSALVCFFVLPKMSPYVLGMLAFAMFGLGIWQHYSMFPYEYRASMVTDMLKEYSGFVMLLAVIFAGTVAILFLHGGNPPAAADIMPSVPSMPAVFGNKNNSKSIFNLSGNSALGNMSKSVTGAFKSGNNSVIGNMFGNTGKTNLLASPSFKVT